PLCAASAGDPTRTAAASREISASPVRFTAVHPPSGRAVYHGSRVACQRAASRFGRRQELCDIRRAARPARDMKGTLALLAKFVELEDGSVGRFKPLRHCGEGGLTTVYARTPEGSFVQVPLAEAPPEAYFRIQGFQLVPAEMSELWAEIRGLTWRLFLPWFLGAMAIKLVGIFANVWRWQILLRGQGIDLGFGYLANT